MTMYIMMKTLHIMMKIVMTKYIKKENCDDNAHRDENCDDKVHEKRKV